MINAIQYPTKAPYGVIIFLMSLFVPVSSSAQSVEYISPKKDSSKSPWSLSMQGYYYVTSAGKNTSMFQDGTNHYIFQGYANYKWLHIEARYNYEDQKTSSAFIGWNLKTGNQLQISATPMAGVVAGNTDGIAPALEFDVSYKFLDFYDESEYVIDFDEKENNFFYSWGEIAVSPFKNLRGGLSAQRTKLYQTKSNIQRGFFAEYTIWRITAGAYYFNPFKDNPFVLASLSVDF